MKFECPGCNTADHFDTDLCPVCGYDFESDACLRFSICVIGEAQTQGSKKGFVHPRLNRAILVEDNAKLKPWRQSIQWAMSADRPEALIDSAVKVTLRVYVVRPRNHYRSNGELKEWAPEFPPVGKDLDKVQRAIGDAATGIWLTDDRRVAWWDARRLYVEPGDVQKVTVTMETLGQIAMAGKPIGGNSHVQTKTRTRGKGML